MRIITNCTECGAELRNEALFCHKCGTRIRDMKPANKAQDPADGFDRYFIPYEEPVKSGRKKYLAISAAVAVLIVLIICFISSNSYRRIFYDPVDYYRYVEKKNAVRNIELINGWYKAGGFGSDDGGMRGSEGTFGLRLSQEILTPASEAFGMGDFSFLGDISADFRTSANNGLNSRSIGLSLNGKHVLTFDTIGGTSEKDLYVRIPELNDEYIDFDRGAIQDLVTLIKNYVPGVPEIRTDKTDKYTSALSSLPRAVKAGSILNKYADIVFDNIEDVEISGREMLELGGVGQKCYILSVKPGYRGLMKIAGVLKEELIADADIKDMIVMRAEEMGADPDDAWNAFSSGLDIIESFVSNCPDLEMKVYVDRRGNIICREIDLNDDDKTCIRYGRAIDGRRFGAQLYFGQGSDGHDKELNLEGNGKKAGDNYSGDFTLTVSDREPINLLVERFDLKAFKEQRLNGIVSLPLGDIADALNLKNTAVELIKDYRAVVRIDTPDTGEYDVELKMADAASEPLVCTCSYKKTAGSPVTLPLGAVRVEELSDMKEYLQTADFAGFKAGLEGAGVPESITGYIGYIEQAVDYIDFIDLLL